MVIDRRDLTDEEIRNLPIDLRVCYFLQAWNISANIKDVHDWVNMFYMQMSDEYLDLKLKHGDISELEYIKTLRDRLFDEYLELRKFFREIT